MDKKLTKRYAPFNAIGSFVCSHCVIESAKNIIGMDFPEIFQVETHKNATDETINALAMKCIMNIIAKNKLGNSLFGIDGKLFMTNNYPGTLFVGANIESIGDNETKIEFFERIKTEIVSLELLKTKVDDDMTEDDVQHYNEMFEVKLLSDIVVMYTKKESEEDVDDMDIGYETGMFDGVEENYHLIRVALYKMAKKRKIKNLDYILDEIQNTIGGMDEHDLKVWSKNFKKYMDKKTKKEQNIEGE